MVLKLVHARLEKPPLVFLLLEGKLPIEGFGTQLLDLFPEEDLEILEFRGLLHLLPQPLLEVSLGQGRDARFLLILLVFLLEDRQLQICYF